ncbi:MAG: class I SAM-dependent methyltransferase [Bacteroidales bacterium]|nr:class I SAM-dependent methyltransferase [Bacteroidales bacterium]
MLNHNKCPLCGSDEIFVLYECEDFLVTGEKFPVSRCGSCNFTFTNNFPEEKDSVHYYDSDEYISHSDTEKGLINRVYHLVRKWMLSSKFRILKKESGLKKASALDIGSGTGYFPLYLQKRGWACLGIEISKDARDYAQRKNDLTLQSPDYIEDLESGSIDIITMWHTLEHFYHPGKYLDAAFRLLKENGLLVIAVPNHWSYDAKKYRELWAAWDVPRHLWHYNPETVRMLAARHHFKLRSMKRLPFDTFYVSILSEKHKKSSLPLVRGLITGFISWMNSLLSIRTTSSLLYIFSKY